MRVYCDSPIDAEWVWLQGMKKQEGVWGRSPPPAPPPHMQGRSVSRCKRNSLLCLCGTGLCCCCCCCSCCCCCCCWLLLLLLVLVLVLVVGVVVAVVWLLLFGCCCLVVWLLLLLLLLLLFGCCCLVVVVWLLLLLLLLVGKGVAARGGNLRKKKLEGGWGGGRSASPRDALDVLVHLLAPRGGNLNDFVLGLHVVLGRGVAARGARVHWEWCDSVS